MNEFADLAREAARQLQLMPWLILLLFSLPLLAAAYYRRAYPHTPLLIAAAAPVLLSFGLAFWPDFFLLVVLFDAAVFGVALVDLLSLPGPRTFEVERKAMRIASLKMPHPVTLIVSNRSRRALTVWIRDDVPQEFEPTPDEFSLRLAGRSRATMSYEMKARRRGAFRLEAIYVRVRSLFGMWRGYYSKPCESIVHVYPDMKQLKEYEILARTNRLSLMGVRRTRKIGQDHEFERLRDYALDDNYKHIDWRATARRNKLTVKDFQSSQSQRLIFLLDCGRMMTNHSAGLSLLDHSLNAMLMLSFVALHKGDSVGLLCFSDTIHAFVPPTGGMGQLNQLLHASFDRFPRLVESRYDEAFLYLATHCRKRSLVILISNLIDEVNSHQVEQYLSSLVGKHLPLGVLLRDHQLFNAADNPNPSGEHLFQAAAAAEILTWRRQVLTDLEHQGVLALDVFPEDMTAPLVNSYLDIKARHLL